MGDIKEDKDLSNDPAIPVLPCYRDYDRNCAFVAENGSAFERSILRRARYGMPIMCVGLQYSAVRIALWGWIHPGSVAGVFIGCLLGIASIPYIVGLLHRRAVLRHYR